MNLEQRNMISATLAQYNAVLTDTDTISKGGNNLGVKVIVAKKRIRLESELTEHLYASGAIEPKTIEGFVESFWYWVKS